ncbi:MAG: hypothetical protein FJX29_00800 [Alphaproteobacteria bacterium]|nr:hypothetical protein [Alphaproteobacteria bacterium]
MPDVLTRQINAQINEILNDPAFRKRHIVERGLEPANGAVEEFAAYIANDRIESKKVAEEAKLTPQ